MNDIYQQSLKIHQTLSGKISLKSKIPIKTKKDLSLAYTPGVSAVCKKITCNKNNSYQYTSRSNLVAVISDGSAVLGLGNIGPEAAMPVMEGKAILFKKFANIDAFPICINTQDTDEIVNFIKLIEPTFGGINLEDISAPRCFIIEEKLKKTLNIPVFHDDQHGTAIVTLAALINAAKVAKKNIKNLSIVISGAGSAGIAIAKLLLFYGIKQIVLTDSKGIIYPGRSHLNSSKKKIAILTNPYKITGNLKNSLQKADVFIGVSQGKILKPEMVKNMNKNPIIFAMANPIPEINPTLAKKAGALIVGTGRSDFPNQINNVLAFPGIFRGLLDAKIKKTTPQMFISAAEGIANCLKNPTLQKIIPSVLDKNVVKAVAKAVQKHK